MKYLIFAFGIAFISLTSFAQQSSLQKIVSLNKISPIKISSSNRNINVISWNDDKVKIVFEGVPATKSSDIDENMEKLGVTVHQLGNNFNIMIKEGDYSSINSMNDFDRDDESLKTSNSNAKTAIPHKLKEKKSISIYIPQGNKLKIDSHYGNIDFKNYFPELNLDITNGSVEADSIGSLHLSSKYANFSAIDIEHAEVDFINGNFTVNNINTAEMDTKYSTIEITTIKDISISSTNDEYILDEVNEIKAAKNYGNFRIGKLVRNIEFSGTNSEVKVRNIAATVSNIMIDDKYADIRIPLKSIKNFKIKYTGPYSNINALFDIQKEGGDEDFRFTSNCGSQSMGSTKIDMKCIHCNVDFR